MCPLLSSISSCVFFICLVLVDFVFLGFPFFLSVLVWFSFLLFRLPFHFSVFSSVCVYYSTFLPVLSLYLFFVLLSPVSCPLYV